MAVSPIESYSAGPLSKKKPQDMAQHIQARILPMRRHTSTWRKDAREDYDFYAGEQWDADDRGQLDEQGRPVITFNRIQPLLDSVSGTEIKNRQEVRFMPREHGDAAVNEILTGAVSWVRDGCDAEDEETDAFMDSLVCGMGWTETFLVYDDDPDGEVDVSRTDPIEMFWDVGARKRNLADAQDIARLKNYSHLEFEARWPGMVDKLKLAPDANGWEDMPETEGDEEHHNDQLGYTGNNDPTVAGDQRGTFPVAEYQWFELEPYYRAVNPGSGKIESVSIAAGNKLRQMLEAQGLSLLKQNRKRYYRAYVVGHETVDFHPLPVQRGFTYQCITGKRDRNRRVWYGFVKQLKDPQRWANKFFSQILHVINTNAKGGLMAEQTAFVDPNKAEMQWAEPDNITLMREGALSGGKPKVMPKPTVTYPEGTDRLMSYSLAAFGEVSGVNLEMLGRAGSSGPGGPSGILEMERRESALVILTPWFDSLRRYRKRQGRLLLEYIQKYLSDGRLIRILGEEGLEQYVPLAKQDDSAVYDVIVEESPSSANQKQRIFRILAELMPQLLQAGVPIPPEIIEYLPLPSTLTAKWMQLLKPKEGGEEPSPEQIKAQGDAMKSQSVAQLNQAKAQTEGAKAQTEQSKAAGLEAQARASALRIAELTQVDEAQVSAYLATEALDRARIETERARARAILQDAASRAMLSGEKEDTETARQEALRRPPPGPSHAD